MYRPGGYSTALNTKNRVALDGLKNMADRLGIALKPIKLHRLPARVNEIEMMVTPEGKEFETVTLRKYLNEIWRKISFEEFASDIEAEKIRKWKKFLT